MFLLEVFLKNPDSPYFSGNRAMVKKGDKYMAFVNEKEREQKVVQEVSIDELWKHTAFIAQEDRLSGSEGEIRAVQYFKKVMESFGFDVKILQIENFISLPIHASLVILFPEIRKLPCITHSFSRSTPPDGIEAELIYVPKGSDRETKGKIVLNEGIAYPAACWNIEKKGALGQVWINENDLPINMIITTIWGHPTPETLDYIPKNVVVSMNKANGDFLKSLCEKGPVRVLLTTETWTGFKKVPLAIADIRGRVEPNKYVLYSSHIDSWHKGATDNATANACILETARILSKYRKELRYGVRCIWWSGHSHGRYSGSTWYADYNWEDLYENAIVHLNVDSLGCQGATDYSKVECTAELYDLEKSLIKDYTTQCPPYCRISRGCDSSFLGIGVPSLFGLLSRQPQSHSDELFQDFTWFWHTEADTLDKIDRDILLKDTQIYMAALWTLCTTPVLPFSFVNVADEMILHLLGLQRKAKDAFDLTPAIKKVEMFRCKASELNRICTEMKIQHNKLEESSVDQRYESTVKKLNQCLIKLSRILLPIHYCAADRFDADHAFFIPPFPRLQQLGELGMMDRNVDMFKFLERRIVREKNRVCHFINEAIGLINETLQQTVMF
jgi:hypothetical protein